MHTVARMKRNDDDEMLTVEEVAQWLRLSPATVRRLRRKGLRGSKLGRQIRFRRADVAAFIRKTAELDDTEGDG